MDTVLVPNPSTEKSVVATVVPDCIKLSIPEAEAPPSLLMEIVKVTACPSLMSVELLVKLFKDKLGGVEISTVCELSLNSNSSESQSCSLGLAAKTLLILTSMFQNPVNPALPPERKLTEG